MNMNGHRVVAQEGVKFEWMILSSAEEFKGAAGVNGW